MPARLPSPVHPPPLPILSASVQIGGPLTYVTASTHCKRFVGLTVDHVLLNLARVTRIDIDGITALEVRAP